MTRRALPDFNEMIHQVEEKYKIQVRDYAGLFGSGGQESHLQKYERITGDLQPNNGFYPDYSGSGSTLEERRTVVRNGIRIRGTQEEYDADFKLIHEQYQRYQKWSKTNPPPEYLDYWHWLLENHFVGVKNPCVRYWPIKAILDDKEAPGWVREITQKIYDEFQGILDAKGGVKVRIQW